MRKTLFCKNKLESLKEKIPPKVEGGIFSFPSKDWIDNFLRFEKLSETDRDGKNEIIQTKILTTDQNKKMIKENKNKNIEGKIFLKNQISQIYKNSGILKTSAFFLFILVSFYFGLNKVEAVDTTSPDVNITYSENPVGATNEIITATYSEPITSAPTISINQPGTADVTNAPMIAPGSVWTPRLAAEANYWSSVTYGNGLFVAVASNGTNRVMTSPDGITWTARMAAEANSWNSITYGNGLFVAVASNGTNRVMTSPDGITWTARTAAEVNGWYSVTYGNGLFVSVSYNGTNRVMTSADGITWTARMAAEANQWMSVAYGNGLFVAVGSGGTNRVMTSPDGITWTARQTPEVNGWYFVTYGNGLFVSVSYGAASKIMTSPDGITWTVMSITSYYLTNITYAQGVFIALGQFGTLITSTDGITWNTRVCEYGSWNSVVYGNGSFVAVSSDVINRVMTSPVSYSYNYNVIIANGTNYLDGITTVSLSTTADAAGNISNPPTNNTFTIDTTGPTVALSYSANSVKAGNQVITATYSSPILGTPLISINQPGSIDISNASMSGSGVVWTYNYIVNTTNGNTYIDGISNVSLSIVTDATFHSSSLPTNNSFIIDTIAPIPTITQTSNPAKVGTNTITAKYLEALTNTPTINIDQPGTTDISNVTMNKTNMTGGWSIGSGGLQSSTWKSLIYGNGIYVAVSSDGTNRVATSTDPTLNIWSLQNVAESNNWQSVTYGNDQFVAVASSGTNRVMTSPDGITWATRTAVEANQWRSITYGNGIFVVVADSGTNRVMTSPDGITWTARSASSISSWYSVAYGNGQFVAVAYNGTDRVMTSPDGITWTSRTASATNSWQSVTYGNGQFVAVASSGSNLAMTSPDGIIWTGRSLGSSGWQAVTYGDGFFVAVGSNYKAISQDGISWQSSVSGYLFNSIIYNNGFFFAVGYGVHTFSPTSIYSYTYTVNQADGSTYVDGNANISLSTSTDLTGNTNTAPISSFRVDTTPPTTDITYSSNPADVGINTITANYSEPISSTPTISINQPGSIDIINASMVTPVSVWTPVSVPLSSWYSITYGNGLFVAVGGGINSVMTSSDGINWIIREGIIGKNWSSVTYGNGLFVAVGFSGVMTSPDGITWISRFGVTLSSVAFGNGLFVSINTSNGNIATSSDGITWTYRIIESSSQWNSIAYNNGLFAVVNNNGGVGGVRTSPDGINWTLRDSPSGNWRAINSGNGIFVAVGQGVVMTSLDGITWISRAGVSFGTWQSITYGNGLFVVVGDGGTNRVITSTDAITWTKRTASEANQWVSVTYGNGQFIAVSSSGTNRVMTSHSGYIYNYNVNKADGSTYVDGNATVSLSATVDLAGNPTEAPTGTTFAINTSNPTVALSYSSSLAKAGTNIITATYDKAVTSAPAISIDQPGITDITSVPMTGSGKVWTYSYNVNSANGSNYIDGVATVGLSTVTDAGGNTALSPTNEIFTIDTTSPNASITYLPNRPVKSGEALTITAELSEPLADTPILKIGITGVNTLVATDMTKIDSTHYSYIYTVGIGDGDATISLSMATDVVTNIVTSIPISGATFKIDNILPTGTIEAVCTTIGNGCIETGRIATPQESYQVGIIKGTASDEVGGTEVSTVAISIQDTTTNKWYSGTSFTDASDTYLNTTGTITWSYNFSSVPLIIDHIYLINIKITDGATNTKIIPLSFKFTNSPPVVSNVTASQALGGGIVSVTYDVTDIESSQTTNSLFYSVGTTLTGVITDSASSLIVSDGTNFPTTGTILIGDEMIGYTKSGNNFTITRGVLSTTAFSHTTGSPIYIKAVTTVGTGIGLSNKGTGKTISWNAQTEAIDYESLTGVIKVVANDGAAGSMIGSLDSTPFIIDAAAPIPSAPLTFDAGTAGIAGSATITIPMPTDISAIEYKISDDANIETNVNTTGWVTITGSTTIPWTFDSDIELKNLKLQFRDAYGNTTVEETISTQTPIPSSSFLVQDTSNISATVPYYDMYIGWQAASINGFSSYKLEYATSNDNINYGSYTSISDSGLSTYSTNYYIHRNLTPNTFYRYRLGVIGTNGNTTVRSNSYITTKTDGVQNYDEGGGGSVATAPKVENVVATQGDDKQVSISYKLTDISFTKKVNPSYESYLFYNIGITLPTNLLTVNTLAVSDASKLKLSGYILVNNEVIKYTGITGNNLTGLVRGTWPGTSGRSTRTNNSFFSGTPVWILASGTTNILNTETAISVGQIGTTIWNTYEEPILAGSSYPNVGIKILVHDNQDALSGPLSNQNDFSENGIISTLDLTAPTISFSVIEATGAESVTPVLLTINLARAYPQDTTVSYSLTGTATSADYTLANGTITFTTGETTKEISIPIINDSLKELDETIIVTLSSPINGVLGAGTTYTYTITDDDQLGNIQFTNTSSEKGEASVTPFDIEISLSEISGTDTTVSYTISGTATNEEDYTLVDGVVTILAGETTTTLTIPVINDTLKEEAETVILTLSNPTNATLGVNTIYTYTILDDDNLALIGFGTATSEGLESLTPVNIPISISSIYPEDISVSYTVGGGTATDGGIDYTLSNGIATIVKGQTMTTIPIIINNDKLSEESETIIITLTDLINATFGDNTTFTYTILDDEIAVSELAGTNVKSTSALITWNTGDFAGSVVEYGIIAPEIEGAYNLKKEKTEKVLGHRVYLSGLTPLTKYYFKSSSTNLAGETTTSISDFTTTSGPVISSVAQGIITDTGVTVTWVTDTPSNSYISFGIDENLIVPNRAGNTELVVDHTVILSNLDSEKTYYYLIQSTDEAGGISEDANGGTFYNFTTISDATAPIVTDIATPIITSDSVAIVWKTNEQSNSQVLYSTTTGGYNESSTLGANQVLNHLVTVVGLTPETTYYYVIKSADQKSNLTTTEEQTFKTTKVKETVIYSGGGSVGVLQSIYDSLLKENEENKIKLKLQDTNAPIISNVTISNITPFSVTVMFETNKETIAFVKYGKEISYGDIAGDDNLKISHSIILRGLTMGTEYHIKVSVMDKFGNIGTGEDQTFKTKYLTEKLDELKKIDNIEQFQKEIEATIESILPSLVPPFVGKPEVTEITENSAKVSFKTNIKAFPVVNYTTEIEYDITKENPYSGEISDTTTKNVNHTLQILGLKPNTKYHIMAKAFSLPQVIGKSDDITFITAASKIRGSIVEKKNDSFTVVWNTDTPTSSIVEYKNIKTGKTSRLTDDAKNYSHSVKVENLTPGTSYAVRISGLNIAGNIVEAGESIMVNTGTDTIAPSIVSFKVDSALVLGRTDRTQTIVSWKTDEPSTSIVYFEEGSGSPDKALVNKQEDNELTMNHVMMLTTLKPGTVYRLQVVSVDDANNQTKLPVRTIITPKRTESIVDVIFKNFDETFNFIKNVR